MGGGFSGGHMGGGHFGGGSFGGSHFSAPSHSFSMPSHSFHAPTQHSGHQTVFVPVAPRSVPSTQFHSPGLQNVQPHLGIHSLPQFQPGHTATHNTWSLPTHNARIKSPVCNTRAAGSLPVPSRRSDNTRLMRLRHRVFSTGMDTTHTCRALITHPVASADWQTATGNNLPGVTSNHHLPGLGGAGGTNAIGHHATLKPTIRANNPFGNHPHIGGHQPSVMNTALNHAVRERTVSIRQRTTCLSSSRHITAITETGDWAVRIITMELVRSTAVTGIMPGE